MAVHTWGSHQPWRKILFHCDNHTVVNIWSRGSTHAPHTIALARLLYFYACNYNINKCVIHIPGVYNEIADSLSHFQMEKFKKQALKANTLLDDIPSMANWNIHNYLLQCRYHGNAEPTKWGYQSGLARFSSFCITDTSSTIILNCITIAAARLQAQLANSSGRWFSNVTLLTTHHDHHYYPRSMSCPIKTPPANQHGPGHPSRMTIYLKISGNSYTVTHCALSCVTIPIIKYPILYSCARGNWRGYWEKLGCVCLYDLA